MIWACFLLEGEEAASLEEKDGQPASARAERRKKVNEPIMISVENLSENVW